MSEELIRECEKVQNFRETKGRSIQEILYLFCEICIFFRGFCIGLPSLRFETVGGAPTSTTSSASLQKLEEVKRLLKMDGPAQVQGDQLNVAVFFQYPVKSVYLMLLCREAYTGKVTLYKVPEKHGHV